MKTLIYPRCEYLAFYIKKGPDFNQSLPGKRRHKSGEAINPAQCTARMDFSAILRKLKDSPRKPSPPSLLFSWVIATGGETYNTTGTKKAAGFAAGGL